MLAHTVPDGCRHRAELGNNAIIRALALQRSRLGQWWRVVLRELLTGIALGALLGMIGLGRNRSLAERRFLRLWRALASHRPHGRRLSHRNRDVRLARRRNAALCIENLEFDPASASATFVATLVGVSGIVIYFSIAFLFLIGTLL